MRRHLCLSILLLGITLASFWPVGRLGFIIYDDGDYIYENTHVESGLTADNVSWAFTTAHSSNWHPLTWLSHMLDCQVFGLNPTGPHWENLGIHILTTLLLFHWLLQLTGARWRSFFVAALFACHPLHVQSVAWLAERKDVLSTFFGLLTLLAYGKMAKSPKPQSERYYWAALGLFALGLMAKPMLVTLPVVMLLLDFWPLERARVPLSGTNLTPLRDFLRRWRPLVIEKIPFFVLCGVSCAITIWAQREGGSVVSLQQMAWQDRYLHAALSYALYLGKTLWPVHLAAFYPFKHEGPELFNAWMLLPAVLSVICLFCARRRPYVFVGWFWFLITLLPVIGLMQVGMQSYADRYMYLPSIGLFILAAWGLGEIAARSRGLKIAMAALAAVVVVCCGLDTRHQLTFWKSNITLFRHVIAVTPENTYMGYYFLGNSYGELGDLDGAATAFAAAVKASPDFRHGQTKLAYVRILQGRFPEAETGFRAVLRRNSNNPYAHAALSLALAGQHKDTESVAEYQAAYLLLPDDRMQKILDANTHWLGAVQTVQDLTAQLKTNNTPELVIKLAEFQSLLGNYPEAIHGYEKALRVVPDSPVAGNNLAWLLATLPDAKLRNGRRAVQLAQHVCALTQYQTTIFLGTLGAAQAESGHFDDAIATAQKACANASAKGETELLQRNQMLLGLYRHHKAFHGENEKLIPPGPESLGGANF